ncbi:hypothetical protein DCAR_0935292 [Daucus carota subsp. sativus]|uniref:EF-hand domain-containing protein n=1 Tax=Daucus carota subsp. sativus TaxID=79200 RepID=A0A175YGK1_DAUCS|nr:hypothetical protein DCAR_0935292 [Daucus carota subsp. sativus]
MANLRNFVVSQYYAAPSDVQTLGHQFFNAMDRDGNGSVDYTEFKNFLVSEGFEYYAGRNLFMSLDGDKNRGLDFWEIMTLYYIIKSKKPFCVKCDIFLRDAYSVCNDCGGGPYYFCNDCYQCHLQEPSFSVQPTSNPLMSETPNVNAMPMASSPNYEMDAVNGSTSVCSKPFCTCFCNEP